MAFLSRDGEKSRFGEHHQIVIPLPQKKMVKYSMGKFIITALQGKGTLVSMNRRVHE